MKVGSEIGWFERGHTPWNKGQTVDDPERTARWKGREAGKAAIGKWVNAIFGKANRCEYPGCTYPRINRAQKIVQRPKSFDWVSVGDPKSRERKDWMSMCRSCHFLYQKVNGVTLH